MKHNLLCNTNIKVSEVSFGGVEIGIPYGIGIKSQAEMVGEDDAVKLLNAAFDKGLRIRVDIG